MKAEEETVGREMSYVCSTDTTASIAGSTATATIIAKNLISNESLPPASPPLAVVGHYYIIMKADVTISHLLLSFKKKMAHPANSICLLMRLDSK